MKKVLFLLIAFLFIASNTAAQERKMLSVEDAMWNAQVGLRSIPAREARELSVEEAMMPIPGVEIAGRQMLSPQDAMWNAQVGLMGMERSAFAEPERMDAWESALRGQYDLERLENPSSSNRMSAIESIYRATYPQSITPRKYTQIPAYYVYYMPLPQAPSRAPYGYGYQQTAYVSPYKPFQQNPQQSVPPPPPPQQLAAVIAVAESTEAERKLPPAQTHTATATATDTDSATTTRLQVPGKLDVAFSENTTEEQTQIIRNFTERHLVAEQQKVNVLSDVKFYGFRILLSLPFLALIGWAGKRAIQEHFAGKHRAKQAEIEELRIAEEILKKEQGHL